MTGETGEMVEQIEQTVQERVAVYEIRSFMCRGCGSCMRVCPDGAITGRVHKPFRIDSAKCSACGDCLEVCNFDAIRVR